MFFVSEIDTKAPEQFHTGLQEAATVFSALLDTENAIQIVFDRDVLSEEWYGCSDGTTTGYMKVKTEQILHSFLPYTKHIPIIIEVSPMQMAYFKYIFALLLFGSNGVVASHKVILLTLTQMNCDLF